MTTWPPVEQPSPGGDGVSRHQASVVLRPCAATYRWIPGLQPAEAAIYPWMKPSTSWPSRVRPPVRNCVNGPDVFQWPLDMAALPHLLEVHGPF